MSTGYKVVKADLFAIYRLEFYKKQRKWKLAKNKKKTVLPIKPETTSSTGSCNVLNQTYDVKTEEPEPEESPLNEAFVEPEGSDKNLSPDPDGVSPKTPDPEILNEQTLHEKWPQQQEATNQSRLINNKLYNWPQMSKGCPDTQIWSQTPNDPANAWSSPELAWARTEMNVEQGRLLTENWSHEQIVPGDALFEEGGDVEDGEGSPKAAEESLLEPGWSQWLTDSSDNVSQGSLDEFIRGAHCAPHSSEMSLRMPPDAVCACCGPAGLEPAHLSANALHASIRRHARALHLLLREAARRDQLTSTRYDTYDSFFEPPTRDVGLTPDFVAGSFRNRGEGQLYEVGRGRGRLQRRVISIVGGRPFRLGQ